MSPLPGIDVSQFQKGIDWNAVAQGNAFAIAKATEGVGFTDPEWANFSAVLEAPGPLVPGAYHFARPDLGNSATAEADWFSSVVRPFVQACKAQPTGVLLVLDLEQGPLGDLSGWRDTFCARVQVNLAAVCGWYSFWNFILNHGLNAATPYWAWFAWPDSNGPMPATAFQVVMQQYGAGPQGGVNCDLDRFFGTHDQLLALAGGSDLTPEEHDWLQSLVAYKDQNLDPLLRDIQKTTATGTGLTGNVIAQILAAIKALPATQQQVVLDAIVAVKADTTELRSRVDKDLA